MRVATAEDVEVAVTACIAMKDKNPQRQMKWAEPEPARAYMLHAVSQGCAVVHNGFFIMYAVTPAWFTTVTFLIEEIIIRIYPSEHTVETAIEALTDLAKEFGCVAALAGDTQIGYMAPKYQAAGFSVLGQQFIKEV